MSNRLKPSAHTDVGIAYEAEFDICQINIMARSDDGPYSWLIDTGLATISPDNETWPTPAAAYLAALRAAVSYFGTQTAPIKEAMRQQETTHA